MPHALVRHPDTPCTGIEQVHASLAPDEHGASRLRYTMIGDADRVVISPLAAGKGPQRRDELWRRTCCELFVHDAAGPGYREYNFAPSGDWAAYRFGGYRAGMVSLETAAPRIMLERTPRALTLTVTLEEPLDALEARRIGIACVVETRTEISYWALAHPPGRPDFHHACAFALTPALAHAAHSVR